MAGKTRTMGEWVTAIEACSVTVVGIARARMDDDVTRKGDQDMHEPWGLAILE